MENRAPAVVIIRSNTVRLSEREIRSCSWRNSMGKEVVYVSRLNIAREKYLDERKLKKFDNN